MVVQNVTERFGAYVYLASAGCIRPNHNHKRKIMSGGVMLNMRDDKKLHLFSEPRLHRALVTEVAP